MGMSFISGPGEECVAFFLFFFSVLVKTDYVEFQVKPFLKEKLYIYIFLCFKKSRQKSAHGRAVTNCSDRGTV